jgi:phospholipase/carboxylesterase
MIPNEIDSGVVSMTVLPHLERYSVSSQQPAVGSVIWLHGLGASGHDFEPLVPELGLKPNVRFLFPHAPQRPVTINGGYVMPAWYDIISMSALREVNHEHVAQSIGDIQALITQEQQRGIAHERIILAGFSQGGAITLATALQVQHPLAGVLAMSTYLIDPDQVPSAQGHANQNTPFLVQHGTFDPVVPFSLGQRSEAALKNQGFATTWEPYPMEHQVCAPQVQSLAKWFQGITHTWS